MPPKGRQKGDIPPDDKRCVNTGVKSSPDGRCRQWRMEESTQCRWHGNPPAVRNAQQRRVAQADAKRRAMQRLAQEGLPVIHGPEAVIAILEERLAVQVAMSRALDDIVRRLTKMDQLRYEHRAGEQIRGELAAWLQVNQMVTKLGSDYLKIGLDERKTRIAEAQARILMAVITAVLGRLDLTSEQRRIAAVAVPEEFQRAAIEAGE
jgi:limonene-1,2-epoxide hydrolase